MFSPEDGPLEMNANIHHTLSIHCLLHIIKIRVQNVVLGHIQTKSNIGVEELRHTYTKGEKKNLTLVSFMVNCIFVGKYTGESV